MLASRSAGPPGDGGGGAEQSGKKSGRPELGADAGDQGPNPVEAGSALLATRAGVMACGGEVVSCPSLNALGDEPVRVALETGVPFYPLVILERRLWAADACPLCAAGRALVDRIPRL